MKAMQLNKVLIVMIIIAMFGIGLAYSYIKQLVPVHFVCDYEDGEHVEFFGMSPRAEIMAETNFISPPGYKSLENNTLNETLEFTSAILHPECILQVD